MEPKVNYGSLGLERIENGKQMILTATKEQLLANPKLIPDIPGSVIKSYTISFFPKGADIKGPYKIKGAELSAETKKIITESNVLTKIFIENIIVTYKDVDLKSKPIAIQFEK